MNQQIVAALQVRLKAFAAAQTPVLRVAYTLAPFTPVATETYLADFHLPARPFNPDIAIKRTRFLGIYQIDVNAPGTINPVTLRALADAVAAHFPRNLVLQGVGIKVQIDAVSAVGPALPATDRTKIPVSITYRADRVVSA